MRLASWEENLADLNSDLWPAAAKSLCVVVVVFFLELNMSGLYHSPANNNQEFILQRAQVISCSHLLRIAIADGEGGLVHVGLHLDRWHWQTYRKAQLSSQSQQHSCRGGFREPSAHRPILHWGQSRPWAVAGLASRTPELPSPPVYRYWWDDLDWVSHKPSCWGGLRRSWQWVLPAGKTLGWLMTMEVVISWEAELGFR